MITLALSLIVFTMIVLSYLTYKVYVALNTVAKVTVEIGNTVQAQTSLLLALAIPVGDKEDLLVKDLPEYK